VSDPYKRRQYQRNRRVVLDAAAYRCYVAGCPRPATTVDHILPLSAGGGHDLANLRACCRHHNSVGGAAITNELRAERRIGPRSRRW
jgi:5-methylcytosine-specific restriction endonuclease McrA